jgi:hypothetical protein
MFSGKLLGGGHEEDGRDMCEKNMQYAGKDLDFRPTIYSENMLGPNIIDINQLVIKLLLSRKHASFLTR